MARQMFGWKKTIAAILLGAAASGCSSVSSTRVTLPNAALYGTSSVVSGTVSTERRDRAYAADVAVLTSNVTDTAVTFKTIREIDGALELVGRCSQFAHTELNKLPAKVQEIDASGQSETEKKDLKDQVTNIRAGLETDARYFDFARSELMKKRAYLEQAESAWNDFLAVSRTSDTTTFSGCMDMLARIFQRMQGPVNHADWGTEFCAGKRAEAAFKRVIEDKVQGESDRVTALVSASPESYADLARTLRDEVTHCAVDQGIAGVVSSSSADISSLSTAQRDLKRNATASLNTAVDASIADLTSSKITSPEHIQQRLDTLTRLQNAAGPLGITRDFVKAGNDALKSAISQDVARLRNLQIQPRIEGYAELERKYGQYLAQGGVEADRLAYDAVDQYVRGAITTRWRAATSRTDQRALVREVSQLARLCSNSGFRAVGDLCQRKAQEMEAVLNQADRR